MPKVEGVGGFPSNLFGWGRYQTTSYLYQSGHQLQNHRHSATSSSHTIPPFAVASAISALVRSQIVICRPHDLGDEPWNQHQHSWTPAASGTASSPHSIASNPKMTKSNSSSPPAASPNEVTTLLPPPAKSGQSSGAHSPAARSHAGSSFTFRQNRDRDAAAGAAHGRKGSVGGRSVSMAGSVRGYGTIPRDRGPIDQVPRVSKLGQRVGHWADASLFSTMIGHNHHEHTARVAESAGLTYSASSRPGRSGYASASSSS